MKLQNVQAYEKKEIAEELTKKCSTLAQKMALVIMEIAKGHDPNIVLGAMNFLHAATIKELVSDDPKEQSKALQSCCIGLMQNLNFLCEGTILKLEKNENTN